jgi:hypothetical protein
MVEKPKRSSRSVKEKVVGEACQTPPAELRVVVSLLDPAQVGNLLRQFIDGTAGSTEVVFWKIAYSGPLEPIEGQLRSLNFLRGAQWERKMAGEPADPAESPRADSKSEQRSSQQTTLQGVPNWEKLARHVRRVARSLVENPVYLAALQRRLDDQRAPRMVKYFW